MEVLLRTEYSTCYLCITALYSVSSTTTSTYSSTKQRAPIHGRSSALYCSWRGLAETAKGAKFCCVHKKDVQHLDWVDQMTSQNIAYFYA